MYYDSQFIPFSDLYLRVVSHRIISRVVIRFELIYHCYGSMATFGNGCICSWNRAMAMATTWFHQLELFAINRNSCRQCLSLSSSSSSSSSSLWIKCNKKSTFDVTVETSMRRRINCEFIVAKIRSFRCVKASQMPANQPHFQVAE